MEHQISNILNIPGINRDNWKREESCFIKSESNDFPMVPEYICEAENVIRNRKSSKSKS